MSEALEILKSCDAFLEGHFLLSSGRHSSAYCQMAYLQQYPDRCAEVMKTVADKVKEMDVDVIVGPAMGGIVYAYELARQTGKRAIFTERVDNACGGRGSHPAFSRRFCPSRLPSRRRWSPWRGGWRSLPHPPAPPRHLP